MTESDKNISAEEKVRSFYDGHGWDLNLSGNTKDAQLFEDLRPSSREYVAACREKILSFLPKSGELFLDAASGPIQYPEYLQYSAGFKKRVCVDISQKALDEAKRKLGAHGETVCASLLDLPFPDNHFDAVLSLHTIYHIDREQQEMAVRQLLRVAKPHVPVVIIYSNPDRLLARLRRMVFGKKEKGARQYPLYFFCYPLNWWQGFSDQADVEIHCWRSLTAKDAQRLIPGGPIGKKIFRGILKMENFFPNLATDLGAYPLIILKKRASSF